MQNIRQQKSDLLSDLVKKLDLDISKKVKNLSSGNKQKLAFILTIMFNPRLIILDEPTSGLDLVHMRAVSAALKELTKAGRTVIVVTHDSELAALCADSVVELRAGKVVASASK